MEAEGENVIYVQVDEHGRVINYTTNMPGGEQVILLQEGGEDESQQQVMYQPQQVAQAGTEGATTLIQTPGSSSIQATDIMQDPNVQAQIMAQASSDAMVIQANTSSINSASTIIETAFSQATNQPPPSAQATIIDGSGNRILITDESQIPMQLVTSTASSAPIILSNEQAQILIAGTQQQQQRKPKVVPQRSTPTIVAAAKPNRPLGRSLISPAARQLVATQRNANQVTSPRSLPAALQPSPQQIILSSPTQITTTTTVASGVKGKASTITSYQSVDNLNVMGELVSGVSQADEEVVRLEEAQNELSDHNTAAENEISQAERDLLEAAKKEQEKQESPVDAVLSQDDMLQIDENPDASDKNAKSIVMPEGGKTMDDQANIPMPEEDILMPSMEQPMKETFEETREVQVEEPVVPEFTAASTPETTMTEQVQVSEAEPVSRSQIATDSNIDSPPAEISVTLTQPGESEAKVQSLVEQSEDQPINEATQLNGNIFANDEEDMETDEAIHAVVVTTVPVKQPDTDEQVKENSTVSEKSTAQPTQDIGETYAKIMELSNKFDNKYAEITGTKKLETTISMLTSDHDTLCATPEDKSGKKILVTPSMIVPKDRRDDQDLEDGKYGTESDDDFEFKPQGVGRPKKTYEGIASRKRQSSDKDNQDSTLNQSIAERRARRKIKPSTRNIDMSDTKTYSTEEDTEDEGLIIEPEKPLEKRGRGRPRKHPQEPRPGTSKTVISSPKTTIISPGKAVQVTVAHVSPSKPALTEAGPGKPATVISQVAAKENAGGNQKRGRGRPRNVEGTSPATPGNSKEQQPDVTSSSDQYSDADPAQKSFMANFHLMSAAQRAAREEESKKRRSKRVSSQAELKAKEEEEKEAKQQQPEPEKKSDNIFDIFDSPQVDPIGEIQSLRDDVDDLKDVNSQLLSKLSSTEDTDVKSLQAKIRKLQTVNVELKTRLRTYETKSASTKFTDRNEIKSLQAKVEKLNNQNSDLKSKVSDLELSRVAVPQTVDKKGVVHKIKSPKSKHVDKTSSKIGSHDLEEWDAELRGKAEALEKKEMKLKLLDRELDERTAVLKAKEGKLSRSVQQLKTKDKELEYREKQVERCVNQSRSDRKSKEDLEHQLELREIAIEEKEKELETREVLLSTTEQQLQALGQELKEKFEYLQNSGQDVSKAKAELENKMAESAANVKKATTTPLKHSIERVTKSTKKRADSPASSRGSTKGSTPSQVKKRRGSSQSSDKRKMEAPEVKSRRSAAKPRKYSPSPEPTKAKAVNNESAASDKDGGGKGKDGQKKATDDSKKTRISVKKRARRESSPGQQAAKKKKT